MGYLICGIYDSRPQICKDYPRQGDWVPQSCAYHFEGGQKKGECDPECQASCCTQPRLDGEPGGAPMPEIAGGLPCRHLIYVERHPAHSRQVSGIGETDTEHKRDREET